MLQRDMRHTRLEQLWVLWKYMPGARPDLRAPRTLLRADRGRFLRDRVLLLPPHVPVWRLLCSVKRRLSMS